MLLNNFFVVDSRVTTPQEFERLGKQDHVYDAVVSDMPKPKNDSHTGAWNEPDRQKDISQQGVHGVKLPLTENQLAENIEYTVYIPQDIKKYIDKHDHFSEVKNDDTSCNKNESSADASNSGTKYKEAPLDSSVKVQNKQECGIGINVSYIDKEGASHSMSSQKSKLTGKTRTGWI